MNAQYQSIENPVRRDNRERSISRLKNVIELPENWNWPRWYLVHVQHRAGTCLWCGGEARPRGRYCSQECEYQSKLNFANKTLDVTSVRRYLHKYFNFECVNCTAHISAHAPSGLEYPVYKGVVDHIKPMYRGGTDTFDNMQLLCKFCDKVKTKKDLSGGRDRPPIEE